MSSQVTGPEASKTPASSEAANPDSTAGHKTLAHNTPVTGRISQFALYKFSKRGYKSMEDVPSFVPKQEMDNARSRLRIAVNLSMMVGALVTAIAVIINEKRYKEAGGISWVEKNQLKHERYRKEHEEQKAANEAKAKEGL